MDALLTGIHVVSALVLIAVVLLQQGKGADIGAAFGGGASQTVFGARGAGNVLTKLTTVFVVTFMLTSMSLAYRSTPDTIFDEEETSEIVIDGEGATEPGAETPSGFEEAPATPGAEPIPGFEEAPAIPETPEAAPAETPTDAPAVDAAPAAPSSGDAGASSSATEGNDTADR